LDAGVNWFDTSATYGQGQSERSLGDAFRQLGVAAEVHVATKVRFMPEVLGDIRKHARESFDGSLSRLGLERVTLLQLHNSVTANREDEPTSITPQDVLGPGGVLEVFEELRREGRVDHLGITGIGQPPALSQVIRSGAFQTMQTPYNLLNPSAGQPMPEDFDETDYGNIIAECAAQQMGVFAIRVFAGGALAGQPPSDHTYKTKFFPMDLYRRDQQRTARLEALLRPGLGIKEAAVRFALGHADVSAAIIGFAAPWHVEEALAYLESGPLPDDVLEKLGQRR
jgi:L-galactose dehydrogenase/L-glyceraldehyde 3-phosphate reductase